MFDFEVLKKRLKKAGETNFSFSEETHEKVEVVPKLKVPTGELFDLVVYNTKVIVRANALDSGRYVIFEPSYKDKEISTLEVIKEEEAITWDFNFLKFVDTNKKIFDKYFTIAEPKYFYYVYKEKYGNITPLLVDEKIKEIYSILGRVYVLRGGRDYITNIFITSHDLEQIKLKGKCESQSDKVFEMVIENGMRMIIDDNLTIIKDSSLNVVELLEYNFLPTEVLAYIWTAISKKANILLVGPRFVGESFKFLEPDVNLRYDVSKEDFKNVSLGQNTLLHLSLPKSDLSVVFEYLIERGINKALFQFVDIIVIFSSNKLKEVYEITGYDYKNNELKINQAFRLNPLLNRFEMDKVFMFDELNEEEHHLFDSRVNFLNYLLESKVSDNYKVQEIIKEFKERFKA